jgi:magnesium and cobalt exporter, CNNM family
LEDPGSSMLSLLVLVVLLALSALFSGSETAFFGLSPYRIRELKDGGHKKAQQVSSLLDKPNTLLTTLLVGNTAVNIAFTSMLTVIVLKISSGWFSNEIGNILATILVTVMLLIFGEVTPKALAAHKSEWFAFSVVSPIQWIGLVLKPITFLVDGIHSFVLKLSGNKEGSFKNSIVTEEIIKTAVTIGEESGAVETDEKDMIINIFKSTDTLVSKVMIPRKEMICIGEEETLKTAARILSEEGISRMPVISNKSDSEFVCGVLYAKDLLPPLRQQLYKTPVAQYMRAAHFCRPQQKVSELLNEMKEISRHLSIVRESNGTIVGLVTLEDLLEVIVGDIMDEHDYEDLLAVQSEGGQG